MSTEEKIQEKLSLELHNRNKHINIDKMINQLNMLVATEPKVIDISVKPNSKWYQYVESCRLLIEFLSNFVFRSGLFEFVKSRISSPYFMKFDQLDLSKTFPCSVWILTDIQNGSGGDWNVYSSKLSTFVKKDQHPFIQSVTYAYIFSKLILLFLPGADWNTVFFNRKISVQEYKQMNLTLKPHTDTVDGGNLIDLFEVEWLVSKDTKFEKFVAFLKSWLPGRK